MMDKKCNCGGHEMAECCQEHKMSKEHLEMKKKMLEEKLKWVKEKLGEK
jgi:hypothetical protein